ncbi:MULTISPECIES: ATP-binding protein [unclassified Mesorhizobium]|uniref:ATP-binding protein n=1 Tax=unclassified Mesorhizobium TaxID=325217 RepID=UPI00112A872B|nr:MULTISPECIES: ATP-binding protein [unclassified Mesorhizobium]MCA0028747.1 ATP-binding protein [Mesorhizobium sp. B263B1A]TPJ86401.1 ATP-binding protein [Mesorhizobium sp. B2-5-12]TPK21845.1 ATP-binding protein [Mesorhizobium sp. B2-5-6]
MAIGQIGSLVRIPQGLVDLIATVNLVGIAELAGSLAPTDAVQRDERWLQVQLLGEIDHGTGRFQRGVGSYPGLDDPVHFATPEQLKSIFPSPDSRHLRIGQLAAAEGIPVCLDAARLVVRHCAVVGSTGSGKTSAVASLLQNFIKGGWSAANIVVVDPHGEYARALAGSASVRSVLADGDQRLRVPYWALPAGDIIRIFAGAPGGATFVNRFVELVTAARRAFVESAEWLTLDPTAVTADTPVPFDIRPIWHRLDAENRETRTNKGDPTTARLIDPGSAANLRSSRYEPYNPGGQAPHQAPTFGVYGTTPNLLRLGLLDPQLRFFQEPAGDPQGNDPLVAVVQEWLGGDQPVSVLDFSGVPSGAADLAIGVVLNLLFELALHSEPEGPGIGRPSPVLIVLEEAHRYLGAAASSLTRDSANRIAREGRKYGVGLLLVTQRPTELPDTALAQCGTLIALRLSNAADQGAIKGALPDTVAGLAAVLPSLRTGEAIVSGESLILPVRALLDRPEPMPRAEDPSLEPWRQASQVPDISPALAAWRGTYEVVDAD